MKLSRGVNFPITSMKQVMPAKGRRFKKRPKTAKGTAVKALKIARSVARAREVKQSFTTFASDAIANLPLDSGTATDAMLAPLETIGQGDGETQRIGDRIKVKGIYIICSASYSASANISSLQGVRYQFVVYQNVAERVSDVDDTGSVAGRFWDIAGTGAVQVPGTGQADAWAPKAGGARRYATKTLVRKLGVIHPGGISHPSGTATGNGATAKIFEGYVRLPKPFITYLGSTNTQPLNNVYCLLVVSASTTTIGSDSFRCSARVDYIDA